MKGVIYSLNAYGHKYIGGSINFQKRVYDHNNNLRNNNQKDYNTHLYKFLRENGCKNICKQMFIKLWEGEVDSIIELKKIEQSWIEKELPHNEALLLNKRFAFGFDPAKIQNHKETRKEKEANNPVEQIICPCGKVYSKKNQKKHEKTAKHNYILGIKDLNKKVDDLKQIIDTTPLKNEDTGINPFSEDIKLFPQYCEPDTITLLKNDIQFEEDYNL